MSISARMCRFQPRITVVASASISPDGTCLACSSGTPQQIFIRRLDQPTATELPGTEGVSVPFFLPDGQRVRILWEPGEQNLGGRRRRAGQRLGTRESSETDFGSNPIRPHIVPVSQRFWVGP